MTFVSTDYTVLPVLRGVSVRRSSHTHDSFLPCYTKNIYKSSARPMRRVYMYRRAATHFYLARDALFVPFSFLFAVSNFTSLLQIQDPRSKIQDPRFELSASLLHGVPGAHLPPPHVPEPLVTATLSLPLLKPSYRLSWSHPKLSRVSESCITPKPPFSFVRLRRSTQKTALKKK